MGDPTAQRLGGRYEMRALIGRGGMAEVHHGFDTRLNRVVAIKQLRLDLARDSVFQTRFRREAQSAASLNHPNIVAVYDTGEENVVAPDGATVSVPYIVMEYVEGRTVKDLLRDGNPVEIDEAVSITDGVLAALEYSHARGLVHRDIKPGNIMLTPDHKVKVMDFGIARALTDSQATMTQTNAVVGTAQYLSPEQARGEQVDTRSDLYSTGVVLYELLTGQPPFRGDSAVSVAYQHVQAMPTPPSQIAGDIPEALDRVVMKALAKNRDERYPTATAMRADLRRAAGGLDVDAPATAVWQAVDATRTMATPPPPPSYAGPTRMQNATSTLSAFPATTTEEEEKKRKPVWLIVLLILLAVGLVGGAYALLTSAGSQDAAKVEVPAGIVGMSQEEAKSAVEAAGLVWVLDTDNPVASDTIEAGKIAKVDPGEGSSVDAGSTVTGYLSSGPSTVTLPDNLVGMSPDEAKQAVEDLGLKWKLESTKEPSDTVEEGKITRTNPSAGSPVPAGSTVTGWVSAGPQTVEVPDVSNKSQDEARRILSDAGLVVASVSTTDAPGVQKDTVVSTTPAAGEKLKKGDSVTLQVASGDVVIPEGLEGATEQDAVSQLTGLGLNVTINRQPNNDVASGVVFSVSVNAGSKVAQGSNVQIFVSTGPQAQPSNQGGGNGENQGGTGGNN